MYYRSAEGGFLRYAYRQVRYWLRLHKGPRWHSDHCARNLLVDIDNSGHVGGVVHHGGVIDDRGDGGTVVGVRDGSRRDYGVAPVDVVKIAPTDWIGRLIDLAGRKRKPTNVGGGAATSWLRTLEILIAYKRHQSRRINRLFALRPWHPTPGAANVGPAAVV